jgi:hypothetical protein
MAKMPLADAMSRAAKVIFAAIAHGRFWHF